MATQYIKLVIFAGFSVAFGGLFSLEAFLASRSQAPPSHAAETAAGAVLLAVVATFTLALALLFAHVRALRVHAAGAGGAEHGFAGARLAAATLAASVAVLGVGAVLRVVV